MALKDSAAPEPDDFAPNRTGATSVRVAFAAAGMPALDSAAGAEALCLFVHEDERPLRGMAGFADWRLGGKLSRALATGRFVGALGDALLLPCGDRLAPGRLFCFGAGHRQTLTRAGYLNLIRQSMDALRRAGIRRLAIELPPVEQLEPEVCTRVFLTQGLPLLCGERVVLMGDPRALRQACVEASGRLPGVVLEGDGGWDPDRSRSG